MHSEVVENAHSVEKVLSLNPLESGHAFRANAFSFRYEAATSLNPLESGHAFRGNA